MKNAESIGNLIQQGSKGWLFLLGSWTIVVLFLSGHTIAIRLSYGGSIQIHHILLEQMFHYYFAFLCPLIYRISYKFHIKTNHWTYSILIHTLMIILMLVGLWWFSVVVMQITSSMPLSLIESIKKQLKFSTIGYFTTASTVYYFIIFSVLSMIRMNRQQQLQEKKTRKLQLQASDLKSQLMQAKLQTLQMQLHPHFFFNALNSISSLIQNSQNQLAYKTIAQLGSLLRTTLELPNNRTIQLSKEIELIDLYLDIEKLRYSDRLFIKRKVPKNCHNAQVPPLILQPLVENCIRHVVPVKQKKIQIIVTAEENNSKLILQVSDNGPGLPPGWSMESNSGIGLKNLLERLKVMYNTNFEFNIISNKSSGLTVRMVIPFSVESEKKANSGKFL